MRRGGNTTWSKSATHYDTLQPHFFAQFDKSCKILGEARREVWILEDDDGVDRRREGTYAPIGGTPIALDDWVFSGE